MCIKKDQTNNEVFNIGSGENYSIKFIYETIKKMVNSNIEPLFGENWDFEAQENLANIEKAKSIGWIPRTDLEDGLKKSIDYIRNHVI